MTSWPTFIEMKNLALLIEQTTTIHQMVDDRVVVKSVHVERKAVEFVFDSFGRTTTFGKWCQRPMVRESNYLQHLYIIIVVVLSTAQEIQNG